MSIYTVGLIAIVIGALYLHRRSNRTVSSQRTFMGNKGKRTSKEAEQVMPTDELFRQKIIQSGLNDHWGFLRSVMRAELRINLIPSSEESIQIGQSKIGGRPDLSHDLEWPREDNGKSLSFIAQFNLSEVSSLDTSNQLPLSGMLYFFYSADQDAWGNEPSDRDKFNVAYYDGEFATLDRRSFPADLPNDSQYDPCRLLFASSVSLPSWEQQYIYQTLPETASSVYTELQTRFAPGLTKLLGHADEIQGIMEDDCEMVTHQLNKDNPIPAGDTSGLVLPDTANQWILLLQVNSNDESGMMWADMGILYFWIKKQDLENRRFDKCWMMVQSY